MFVLIFKGNEGGKVPCFSFQLLLGGGGNNIIVVDVQGA